MIRFKRNWLNYAAILLHLAGLCIFIFHYLSYTAVPDERVHLDLQSISKEAEKQVASIEIKCAPSLNKPSVSKLILVIIDALRGNFIPSIQNESTSENDYRMPFIEKLIHQKQAVGLISLAETPTVTMPRIKAIVSGTHPSFIDLIYNLNAAKFGDDNLIERAVTAGKRILFFGDDTWLQMFPPEYFVRMNTTSSFFATDYTTCDTNVTNSMLPELIRLEQWDMMILHYLGVDHIGHSHGGAKSHLMPDKLREMDQVIQVIFNSLANSQEQSLILITGDHGMTEIGNHGGSTREEVETALVAIPIPAKEPKKPSKSQPLEMMQIDIAVTLSAIFGLSTPSKSKGKLSLPILNSVNMPEDVTLCHLFSNSLHILRFLDAKHSRASFPLLKEALTLHSTFLKSSKPQPQAELIAKKYSQFISELQSVLLRQRVSRHSLFSFLTLAIAISLSSLLLLIRSDRQRASDGIVSRETLPSLILYLGRLLKDTFVSKHRSQPRFDSIHCDDTHSSTQLSFLSDVPLLAQCVLAIVLLTSTSFIEAEQFYWFYAVQTYFLCRLIHVASAYQDITITRQDSVEERQPLVEPSDSESEVKGGHSYSLRSRNRKLHIKNRDSSRNSSTTSSRNMQHNSVGPEKSIFSYSPTYMSTLIADKCEKIFQASLITGTLYICSLWIRVNAPNATDMRTFLSSREEKHTLSALVIAVFVVLTFITPSTRIGKQHCLLGAGLFWTYLYKCDLGQLASFHYPLLAELGIEFAFSTVTKAYIIYVLMFAIIGNGLWQRFTLDKLWLSMEDFIDSYVETVDKEDRESKRRKLLYQVVKLSSLRLLSTTWVLYSCLLSKCELIPLIGLNVLVEKLVSRFMKSENIGASKDRVYLKVIQLIITYYMLAMNAFFSMGNSNSTSTIDVAAGFTGLQSYSLTIVSFQVISSTYCLYIYWIFMLFVRLQESRLSMMIPRRESTQDISGRSRSKSPRGRGDALNEPSAGAPPSQGELHLLKLKLTAFATSTSCFNFLLFIRFASASFYLLVAFSLQNHLFIWSVICPKLLYESFHSLLLSILLFIVSLLQIADN